MKVGTSGLLRAIKSVGDYLVYFEVRLAPRPWLVVLAVVAGVGLSILSWLFSTRIWSGPAWMAWLPLVGALLAYIRTVSRADHPVNPHFVLDQTRQDNHENARPTVVEDALGFARVSRSSGFDGPVVVSDAFNAQFAQADTDWPLEIHIRSRAYDTLISHARLSRRYLVAYGRQKIWSALKSGKALINEPKIGFLSAFPPEDEAVSIYKTDYFTSLSTAERVADQVVQFDADTRTVLSEAAVRSPFVSDVGGLRLPQVHAGTRPPVSLHLGIEVIAVSSDGVLRFPIQSAKTQYSQLMRAPLASGSIDWDDVKSGDTFKSMLRRAGQRELAEEWGQRSARVHDALLQADLHPVAYFRNLKRTGKPQFLCVGRFDVADSELSADTSEVYRDEHSTFDVETVSDLAAALKVVLEKKHPDRDSVPLLGCVHSLYALALADPDRVAQVMALRNDGGPA